MNESRADEPVCSCRDLESMLAAYVDGEAPASDGDKVRAHVEACAPCRERLTGERAAKEAVRAHRSGLRPCAPQSLRNRCASMAAERERSEAPALAGNRALAQPQSRRSALLRWAPLSLAATLFLAVAVVFGFGLTDKAQALAFQTTIDHVKCARLNTGAPAAEAGDAARQWQSRFGWKIGVPAPARESHLELRGVRRCGVIDGRVAHIMYTWLGEPLSVYVLPKQTMSDAATLVHRFRHNAIMWSKNDRTYILVTSHRRDPELDHMVAYVRSTAY